jgi:hypothetical protein
MLEEWLLAQDIKEFPGNGDGSLIYHGEDDCAEKLEDWEDWPLWDRDCSAVMRGQGAGKLVCSMHIMTQMHAFNK